MSKPRAVVALSGGVDSAVAAALLLERGYDVTAVHLLIPGAADESESARAAAYALGIPLFVRQAAGFERAVKDYFIAQYRAGRTPSPCVRCNPAVKIHELLRCADELGAQYAATGHYARVQQNGADGRTLLMRAAHRAKDQSYMLHRLSQSQLARLILPLGGMSKAEAREYAARRGLSAADRADSQDNCFVPDGDYAAFIERESGPLTPGLFRDADGGVIAPHAGMERYTVGQRRGLGVSSGGRLYVCGIDAATGDVTLGGRERALSRSVALADMVYIPWERPPRRFSAGVKLRFSGEDTPAEVETCGDSAVLHLQQSAVAAPGQYAVLYDGEMVLGGGVINGRP